MMRNWLNNRFGINLSENDLTSIKDFALIWNVFESNVCLSNFSIQTVEQELQNREFDINDFQIFLNYFSNRYITNGKVNNRFQHLNFRNNDRKELVENVLLGNNNNIRENILALVIIVYRFRNNLFHGLKNIQVIGEQKENFENANDFLKILLDRI